ncbi:succinate--CoA ligase subunit beta [Oculatella sp. FACHB-28]|uniref:succinate--CoA ligase subunit beta n=1 Tax=Oculatella sp. FACHB-28 TaxID=2692845 RepID=UPI001688A629|nr:succinate--CoA ligase subunit beta [Oculatella sp. FACHB-28]MBD2054870.1 succinate--CoA ligase subunit beta [Oculatella sp. FACHB-28]
MDLLEYQAKQLFHEMGIPILPSQQINHPKDLKGLKIPYPVVLKSQVYTGGRGKAGGIRFVENTIDAVAAAQTIFNLPITGMYPAVLLAEAKYDADRELYLAVILDWSARRPLLLGSQQGGLDVEATIGAMQQVIVDQEFSPFYARRLALKMGLQGELIQSVSDILEKMYQLFLQKDLDLVEINPLAVSPAGELMALDGKITANDDALGRHPDLAALQAKIPNQIKTRILPRDLSETTLVELEGNIGILCNGAGLTMSTVDLVHQAGGRLASFLNLGSEYRHNDSPAVLRDRIQQGLELMMQSKNLKVVLVNILGNVMLCKQTAEAIATHLQRQLDSCTTPFVVRLVGDQFDESRQMLQALKLPLFDDLDEAIAEAISLSNSVLRAK